MKNQQDKVYAAENGCRPNRVFTSAEEVSRYVNALRDEMWWDVEYSMVRYVEVLFTEKQWSVGGFNRKTGVGQIDMGVNHHDDLSVVHELAHVLADARYGSQAHCPWFARTYAELTYRLRGSGAWLDLKAAFDAHGVDYQQRRTS